MFCVHSDVEMDSENPPFPLVPAKCMIDKENCISWKYEKQSSCIQYLLYGT